MANFCAKCGAALSANEQFCTSCGAAAATGGAVAAPSQPTAAQPAAAPAQSGGSAVKIILIIVAIVVGLGILGLGAVGYTAWRISRAVHVSGHGDQVTLQTAEGKVNLNASENYTAAELGTDPYPGAQSTRGGMKMDLPGGSMVTGVYLTSDSKQQVVDYYKGKFGSTVAVFDTPDAAILTFPISKQESVMVTITAKPSENDGKTRITITHTKSNKAS
ncbi:MAG: zinc ribbon domain-containing protein [Terracidiphilus sp.]